MMMQKQQPPSMTMQGKLIRDNSDPIAAKWPLGAYGFHHGVPYAITPNGELANLSAHSVVEKDGAWTVTPSIAVSDPERMRYHGYLRAGVWTDA
jgi:hypothetical protein